MKIIIFLALLAEKHNYKIQKHKNTKKTKKQKNKILKTIKNIQLFILKTNNLIFQKKPRAYNK